MASGSIPLRGDLFICSALTKFHKKCFISSLTLETSSSALLRCAESIHPNMLNHSILFLRSKLISFN